MLQRCILQHAAFDVLTKTLIYVVCHICTLGQLKKK